MKHRIARIAVWLLPVITMVVTLLPQTPAEAAPPPGAGQHQSPGGDGPIHPRSFEWE